MNKTRLSMSIGSQSLAGIMLPKTFKGYPLSHGNYFSVLDLDWVIKYQEGRATRFQVYENLIRVLNMNAENYQALEKFCRFQSCEAVVYHQVIENDRVVKWAVVCDERIPSIKWLDEDFCFLSHHVPHPIVRQQMADDYEKIREGFRNRC